MVVINNNSGLTEVHYSGTDITEIYVGENLVWPVTPPTPIDGKVVYTINGNTNTIPCNGSGDTLSYIDIMTDIRDKGGEMSDISAMTYVAIGDCVTEINYACFDGCVILSSVTIPSSVTSIGQQAFKNCYSLSSVTVPDGVTSISSFLMEGCYNLSSFTIPNGVTQIGMMGFDDCLSYLDITIPSSVTSIGDNAFRAQNWTPQDAEKYSKMMYMKDHRVVRCLATTPPQIGLNAFSIISGGSDIATYKIYVPSQSVDAYKSAWGEFANRIEPIAQ